MSNDVLAEVKQLIEPVLKENELSLFDMEYVKEGQDFFLRIYIDKRGGVDLNLCSLVSEQVSELLDEHDPIKGAYFLEVSSPGAERPLTSKEDFQNHVGEHIYVSLYVHIEGEKEFVGTLLSFENEVITIEYQFKHRKKQVEIPFDKVAKARLAVKL
ncbi:MAG TPA: ribosome maturation factor RimP [Candidatus Pseudogracilibacillus intestinigallinarum]|uniref:Ribosome maturation factor RimP n=1 Tax=Candidatus Pseudogracilibacillus intestinigallinarum TaxID=2838742 RepID=A0A9D1TL03_9BACI|nr:ribosome maturation factor RimP [Candidatus Pseudogracilibacillus intestinigallinarum]